MFSFCASTVVRGLGLCTALLSLWAGDIHAAPFAYISNSTSDSVSVINTASNQVVASVALSAGAHPFGVAVNPGGTRAYVTNLLLNSISVIDTVTYSVLATVTVGAGPYAVAVNPAGTRVYVANNAGAGTLTGSGGNDVTVIDATSNTVAATVTTGAIPFGIAVNPGGTLVYVTNPVTNTVSVIETVGNSVVATIASGVASPFGVAFNPASTRAYVTNARSGVSVIDTTSHAVIGAIPVGSFPYGVAFNPAGTRAYVSNNGNNNVSVIDTSIDSVIDTVNVGSNPRGISVNPAGTRVYVANHDSNTVSVIDTTNNSVIATVPVESAPVAFGQFIGGPPATAPGAPVIGGATPGNTQATISFTPPAFDGGSPITGYTLTCNPGSFVITGTASPLTFTGLANGTAYACSVNATNAIGAGPASITVNVTPVAPQTITFANPGAQNFGTTPTLTATASSGLMPTFTSSTTGVCTITSGGVLTFVTVGACTINAGQAGNASILPAPQVSQTFTVNAAVPGAPVIGGATPGNGTATVSFLPPASNGGSAITGYTATCGAFSVSGTTSPLIITGLVNGTTYLCSVTTTNAVGTGPASATVSVTPISGPVCYTAPSATGSGTINACYTGGGPACVYGVSRFIPLAGNAASPPAGSAPAGATFPHGLFDFTTSACIPGSTITMTITYPSALAAGTQYWKYGPTPGNATPHWYVLPATIAGNTGTFSITDGGLGDDDLTVNGSIVDQGGPGGGAGGAVNSVPTLSEWAMLALTLLLSLAGARRMRAM